MILSSLTKNRMIQERKGVYKPNGNFPRTTKKIKEIKVKITELFTLMFFPFSFISKLKIVNVFFSKERERFVMQMDF